MSVRIWREEPGVISEDSCWCAYHQGYLYTADTFAQLVRVMTQEYKSDRHLVG